MFRKPLGYLLWIVIPFTPGAFAQTNPGAYTVRGVVADSASRQVIPYVTIGITDGQQTPLASAYSGENGAFKLSLPQAGRYQLVLSSVGYRPLSRPLLIDKGKTTHQLDTVFLGGSTVQLSGIQVISQRQLIEQKPGMLVYNAESDISNRGGTAADVLRKAPALNVDPQGNVTMRGSGTLKILIDGKYSGQIARSPADALNMMPANIIRSVEIITSPSARYDAEGAAGVINIITQKGNKSFSGNLEAMASNWEQAFNPRISMSRNKWNMSLHGHLHRLQDKSSAEMERTVLDNGQPTMIIRQETRRNNIMPHSSGELALGFLPDSLSEISLSINGWLGNWPDNSRQHTLITLPNGAITDQYQQQATSKEKFTGADIALGYTRRLKRDGQEITLLAQFSPSKENTAYNSAQNSDDKIRYREDNVNRTTNREWTFQADYTHPLTTDGRYTLQSGLKSIFRHADKQYQVWAADGPPPAARVPQQDRSDNFIYSQDVLAGYLLLKMKLPRGWNAEAGSRLENTHIKGRFNAPGSAFSNDFLNFIPTANISKKLNEAQTITLSYTQRLTRPYIWDLNPNANASDPRNIIVGNPQLRPETMHQGELSYGWTSPSGTFINAAAFLKKTDNTIIDLTTTNAAGIATTRKENLAGNTQYGLNLSGSVSPAPNWSFNSNVNINHLNFESDALMIVNTGWAADFNLNALYKLPGAVSLQAFGEYDTRIVTLQGHKTPRFYYSFSAKKEIKVTRMTVTLAAINPFNQTIRQKEYIHAASFRSGVLNRYYNQALKITLNWEFGSMFEQREKKKISNDDVREQGKG
nr:TonB-dependent receptor [uncultured Chitinophaga sp.]